MTSLSRVVSSLQRGVAGADGRIIVRGRSLMCGAEECSTFHVNEPVSPPHHAARAPPAAATSAVLLHTQLTPICGNTHPILLQNLRSPGFMQPLS